MGSFLESPLQIVRILDTRVSTRSSLRNNNSHAPSEIAYGFLASSVPARRVSGTFGSSELLRRRTDRLVPKLKSTASPSMQLCRLTHPPFSSPGPIRPGMLGRPRTLLPQRSDIALIQRDRSLVVETIRKTLLAGVLQIGSFWARPLSEACGEIERQSSNAVVLPFSGVFSKHDAPGRHVIGTPSHAVLFAATLRIELAFPALSATARLSCGSVRAWRTISSHAR